ncbi:MAG TPA: hypothetical protein VN783_09085 [Thermoanaerobaculia bacterium]|nr:hypothetical protein [Thermoanaerobaculia bacterium]
MFAQNSRYYNIPDLTYTAPSGQKIRYKARRFLPEGRSLPLQSIAIVAQSDRLDLIAYRTLGNPELAWRIADANDAMDPFDLTAVPGRVLGIPRPLPS